MKLLPFDVDINFISAHVSCPDIVDGGGQLNVNCLLQESCQCQCIHYYLPFSYG